MFNAPDLHRHIKVESILQKLERIVKEMEQRDEKIDRSIALFLASSPARQ
jgi:exonuclease VII small subunit